VGTVAKYVERFSQLVDQLAAYESIENTLYFTMRFIDGLRDDIKPMVMIQRPSNLDSAYALALVQEEDVDVGKKREYMRFDPSSSKVVLKPAFPLPPPPKLDKSLNTPSAEGRRGTDAARGTNTDDKFRALKQYHRARGLCDKCAEKWVYGHTCAPTMQLHAI
jgi:hypothetical protein